MAGSAEDRSRLVDGVQGVDDWTVGDAPATTTTSPLASAAGPTSVPTAGRSRLRARLVSYGLVAGLLLAAWSNAELWPITSFRLFSAVRTDRSYGLELVAVRPDGHRQPVRMGSGGGAVANPSHQLDELREESPPSRRRRVLTLIELAGLEAHDFRVVQLERVERRLDPDGGPSTEVGRTVVVEVEL